jgi:uncharacterized RDD family membrane protein YckC
MMNDSVREEIQTSIVPTSGQLRAKQVPDSLPRLAPPPKPVELQSRPQSVAPAPKSVQTAGFGSPKTNPTLVDFQNKNSALPEWRLQVQNAVRQRMGTATDPGVSVAAASTERPRISATGVASLKAEPVRQAVAHREVENADPVLAAAMKRIENSRKAFLPEGSGGPAPASQSVARSFPFNVVARTPDQPRDAQPRSVENERPRPAMVAPLRMEKRLDTNKLPRISAVVPEPFVEVAVQTPDPAVNSKLPVNSALSEFSDINRIHITAERHDDEVAEIARFDDGIEDLAPFSVRFNAGLFDLMLGVFATMAVLSPMALADRPWMTASGVLIFGGTCSIIMFAYLTVSLGLFGKTLGMRLFQLELVDAEENDPPSLKQASVSSSLYILSIALGGIGFLSIFFNEERRAVHDLLSGTIVVREF